MNWDLNNETLLICNLWESYLDLLGESRKEMIALLSNATSGSPTILGSRDVAWRDVA